MDFILALAAVMSVIDIVLYYIWSSSYAPPRFISLFSIVRKRIYLALGISANNKKYGKQIIFSSSGNMVASCHAIKIKLFVSSIYTYQSN